jgi:gamma-glutamyltranspeptidase/glutathione hydrolase
LSAFAETIQLAKHAVRGRRGVVAAQNRRAAVIGAEILAAGGDAVDAAIATSLALAATEPWMSGLGGGATMLVYRAAEGRAHAFDGGMVAPKALDPAAYPLTGDVAGDLFGWPQVVDDRNLKGPLSFAVPGGLAALGLAHGRFGRQPLAAHAAPAVAEARLGLEIDWYAALLIATAARDLRDFPGSASVYLPDGLPPVPSSVGGSVRLPLHGLADSLAQIGEEGTETLYRGGLAERLVADAAALGSPLAMADLAGYAATEAAPLSARYGAAEVFAMPGLFAGHTLLDCLARLEGQAFDGDWPEAAAFTAYARTLRQGYAQRLARDGHAADAMPPGDGPAPSCTSHLSVIDEAGNMVALTQTLLSLFGSKVVLPSTGILMNNGIMWFDPRPGRPNSMAPGARPLSNMCPVIAQDQAHRIALGASGGRKIMPAVMQLLSFVFDYDMSLEEAFAQGRIDVAGDGTVTASRDLPEPVRDALAAELGAVPARATAYPMRFACPVAVLHDLIENDHYGTAEVIHPWADAVAVE